MVSRDERARRSVRRLGGPGTVERNRPGAGGGRGRTHRADRRMRPGAPFQFYQWTGKRMRFRRRRMDGSDRASADLAPRSVSPQRRGPSRVGHSIADGASPQVDHVPQSVHPHPLRPGSCGRGALNGAGHRHRCPDQAARLSLAFGFRGRATIPAVQHRQPANPCSILDRMVR